MQSQKRIDDGTPFDWGRTSADYARYRDIYPPEFYARVRALGLCPPGGRVLDLGTGTGVLPRHLQGQAHFVGVDLSPQQIDEAKRLSAGMDIEYIASAAEALDFADDTFDAVTACQCFHYFEVDSLMPALGRMLKAGGLLGILFMEWLPDEDEILRESEKLVLKYSPAWNGAGFKRRTELKAPAWAARHGFSLAAAETMDLQVPFTRESWCGRMRACRGVGASLPEAEVRRFEAEMRAMLAEKAPEQFTLPHQALFQVLRNDKAK